MNCHDIGKSFMFSLEQHLLMHIDENAFISLCPGTTPNVPIPMGSDGDRPITDMMTNKFIQQSNVAENTFPSSQTHAFSFNQSENVEDEYKALKIKVSDIIGKVVTKAFPAPPSVKASTDTSTGCASCLEKSEDDKLKCVTCHPEKNISAVSTSKPLLITGFPVNTATTSSTFGTTNPTFSFGVKPEATKQLVPSSQATLTPFGSTPIQSVFGSSTNTPSFGKPNETPGGFNFASSTPANTVAPVFQFGVRSSPDALSWNCTKCGMKNESEKEQCSSCQNERPGKKISGFTFKANNEVKPSVPAASFNAPAPATTASGFTFNTAAPTSSTGFVFGVKNEPVTSTPAALFSFGSAAPKPSFEPYPAPATPFHFQAAVGTAPASTPSFGNTPAQPMFGNAAAASNLSPEPVFQFGAVVQDTLLIEDLVSRDSFNTLMEQVDENLFDELQFENTSDGIDDEVVVPEEEDHN